MTYPSSLPAGPARDAQPTSIGLFDSGLGGLSVLMALRALLPHRDLVYYADTRHFPYGGRPAAEVTDLARSATAVLLRRGAGAIVVACNTATTAAVALLRERFAVPVVGIEPAIKPAAQQTRARRIALLATESTVRAPAVQGLIERYGTGVDIVLLPAPGLADRVEHGDVDGTETRALLARYLARVRQAGVDVLVLGCTHYAFLRPAIERTLGPCPTVIEPSEAVARQVARVAGTAAVPSPAAGEGRIQYLTSGDPERFRKALGRLRSAGFDLPDGSIDLENGVCDLL